MSLLQPAVSSSAFLKMGLLGFQGGGKSMTAAKVAIGLHKHITKLGLDYSGKPVAMFDTETGSDWLIPLFKAAGVPFFVAKANSFADLLLVMDEAEKKASALIIDSITHPWRELCQSYQRSKEKSYLAMDDWGYLKGEHGWKQFTDRFINSKLHIIMAGRAGYEYDNYVEDGRKKMEKVGTKMKTEGETGFEPSLLVLMEQVEDMRTNKVIHRAIVQKDRSTLLDGKLIDNPDFDDFLPHINCLSLGATHLGVRDGDSQHILKTERRDWSPVQRRICIDKIQTVLALHYPGSTAVEKTAKLKLVLKHFNTVWTEIEEVMPLPDLREGYNSLHLELTGQPSEYAAIVADVAKGDGRELNDSLPDHSSKEGAVAQQAGAELTLEQKLIADLPEIKTVPGLLAWAIEVTNKHRATLGEDAFNRVNVAMMARQTEVLKQQSQEKPNEDGEGGAQPDAPKDTPKPASGKKGGGKRPDVEEIDERTGLPKGLVRDANNKLPKAPATVPEQSVASDYYENA